MPRSRDGRLWGAYLVRLTTGFEIVVGGAIVPVWVSFLGALIAAPLAVWMAVAARHWA